MLSIVLYILGGLLIAAQIVVGVIQAINAPTVAAAAGTNPILEVIKAIAEKVPYATAGVVLILIGLALDGHISFADLFTGDAEDPAE